MTTRPVPMYAGYRFPAEMISYAVYLCFRFPLSLRMVEEMLVLRGITVSHETVRQWGLKFDRAIATRIRQRHLAHGDNWHVDEAVLSIAGKKQKAAKRLLRKLLKKQGRAPRVMITDKLKSYAAAKKDLKLRCEHRQHKGLNNRADNSHQPTRRRKRQMKRFKSPRQVQRFLSIHDPINNLVHLRRDHLTASVFRAARLQAFAASAEVAGAPLAA
ncbi:IS6 family transposase [Azospirillum sp.]|uniref:IS6 family transposase n=1 Tax=Azospirillum sp. TaxID=34012 RepID=UPI003D70B5CF